MNRSQRLIGHSGVENHAHRLAVLDGFSSPRVATHCLLRAERLRRTVWEPAAGLHAMADELRANGHRVFTSDVRRWDRRTHQRHDFLTYDAPPIRGPMDLVTNPPYAGMAMRFAEQACRIMPAGSLVCMLLKLQFLEGMARNRLFRETPPLRVHVFSKRLPRMHRFDYAGAESGSTLAFMWMVWKVGVVQDPTLHWIAPPSEHVVEPARHVVRA